MVLLTIGIALTFPSVQTRLGKEATILLNKEFGTDITIQEANFTIFGGVKLKKVLIKDHKKDTLFYINRLKTNILDLKKLKEGDLHFGEASLDGLIFNLKNYKGEKDNNLDYFIALFDSDKPSKSKKKFLLTAQKLQLTNSKFIFNDYNLEKPLLFSARKLNAIAKNFKVLGPDVTANITEMSFIDNRGLEIENLISDFTYTKKHILLEKLTARTPNSDLKGNVELRYDRKDFVDFNNKVIFDVKLDEALISSTDLKLFYGEFGKNQIFYVSGNLMGTLNNFSTKNLRFFDKNKSQIAGNFTFKNLFSKNKGDFYMIGDFTKISSTYNNLTAILPKVLGDNLPSTFKKFGVFTISGTTEVTLKTIKANVLLKTALGNVKSNLSMTNINNIDNATYIGNVKLDNFNLGKFLNKTEVGVVNLDLDVNGKGFKQKFLDTKLKGSIKSIYFNKYNYQNIVVDGKMVKSIFQGDIKTNDPNLQMDFDGTLDISNREKKYNFHADVEYANLKKLKLYTTDSISVFRGDVTMKLQGNSIDNLSGDVFINRTSYENNKDTYFFDDFIVKSSFDENRIRTMTINSPDIIEGKVVGKFQFNQLQKLVENSLGSLYANYSPNKVLKGQFLKFDFNVYNKLIEVFFPEIQLGTNTVMKGNINSDNGEFKFNFKSPQIIAYKNSFDNINIEIDNKNPLYNAYVSLDSMKVKNYKVSDFSLINVTANDTLFFRTEFKGGQKAKDFFNLNLYHTINGDNNSVVGIKKSEVNFRDFLWFLNENETKDNKIIFNKKLTDFSIEKIAITHEKQAMELMGVLRDSTYKDLKLALKNVELDKITPTVDSIAWKGKVNGLVNFKQNKTIYEPSADIVVDSLSINKYFLGNLSLAVTGDSSFKNFRVNSVLKNKELESFSTEGSVFIENKKTLLDLDMRLNNFNIAAFGPLGGSIITNIRGLASGTAHFNGQLDDPNVIGRLYLNKAGLKIPYLNVDYNFNNNSIVDITESQFLFRNIDITDTKHATGGLFRGEIQHKNFSDWNLDLNLSSNRLVALDTKDSDDALYYGTAFIDGEAEIKGPINKLIINVNAKSEKGTSIKIPITTSEATTENEYIKFKVPENVANSAKNKLSKTYNGVELNFELDITPNAEIEIIIDKNSGHAIKGRGNGTLAMAINTLGKFKMNGDFQVYKGNYFFKYGGLIDKKFDIKPLGSISWDGDPLGATLNMEAIYKTEANPGVLLESSTFVKKVPTEVVIKLTDQLKNPIPDISINFPSLNSVQKSELEYKLADKDKRQTQAMALLSSGSFLSEKGVGENIITGNLLEKANSLFQDIFTSQDDKLKINPYFVQSDRTNAAARTDAQVGVTLSTQISDKITINGKFGVPVGGISESTIVGNVEIEMRLNEDGSLKARVFNRENDSNFIGESIGYTQGIGLSYDVDFNTFRELISKIIKRKTVADPKNPKKQDDSDSDLTPEFIRFTEERLKKAEEKPKKSPQTVPDSD